MSLTSLCQITKSACDLMAPMICSFYSSLNSETSKLKADASVFTIADGVVQHLLQDHLFGGNKFLNIVGEEDGTDVNISIPPFKCDDLIIPNEFYEIIVNVRDSFKELAPKIDTHAYKDITVFLDPIDGTREFSSGKGEQCSICVGFADNLGRPVAGLVYRPLTLQPTWAMGSSAEGYKLSFLNNVECVGKQKGLLTSNGSISPFLVQTMQELKYERIPSGGAGNKMLMLLEGRGNAYIQDRGVSRWDTCGAQAVLESHGGTLSKLNSFILHKKLESYTYLKASTNLDFEPEVALLTPFNSRDNSIVSASKCATPVFANDVEQVKTYANLCGILALCEDSCTEDNLESIHCALIRARSIVSPSFD